MKLKCHMVPWDGLQRALDKFQDKIKFIVVLPTNYYCIVVDEA